MTGRKILLDNEMITKAAKLRKKGMPKKYVADLLGVGRRTYYAYLNKGEEVEDRIEDAIEEGEEAIDLTEKETLYLQFLHTQREAWAQFVEKGLVDIIMLGPEGYQWALPRLDPEYFANRTNVGVKTEMPAQLVLGLPEKGKEVE